MAVTITQISQAVPGAAKQLALTVALDNSYPNPSGYVFNAASFGVQLIRKIANIEPVNLPAAATWVYWIVPTYDPTGNIVSFALHLAVVSTGLEVANAVNVSTASYNIIMEVN